MKNIMIVGGGSAGWMTAATLIHEFPNKSITLIESPNIQTIGVGESTLQQIRAWTTYLGIEDKDFVPFCDATFKQSIKFTDFYKKGESFHYPFGDPVLENTTNGFNDWWFKKILFPKTPYSDFADSMWSVMAFINQNKMSFDSLPGWDFKKSAAFHFDAIKFGLWLKDHFCLPKGVKHIKETNDTIEQNEKGIVSLNGHHKADLFIDCTGVESLLLEKTLGIPFIFYSHLMSNTTAWATKIPYKENKRYGYTNCTAIDNGWIWQVPLWSRLGCGYVYSDQFIDDDNALKQFQNWLGTEELEFRKIPMKVGIYERLWVKNVCAIGMAAGFIEPLESTGLFTIHEFLHGLVRELKREKVSQWDKDNFTFGCKTLFGEMAEFVGLHYALSHRDDTEYWKHLFNKEWSDCFINPTPTFIQGFLKMANDRRLVYNWNSPNMYGVSAIAAGMHYGPTDKTTLMRLNYYNEDQLKQDILPIVDALDQKQNEWKKSVNKSLSVYDFLKENFYETS